MYMCVYMYVNVCVYTHTYNCTPIFIIMYTTACCASNQHCAQSIEMQAATAAACGKQVRQVLLIINAILKIHFRTLDNKSLFIAEQRGWKSTARRVA